MKTYMTSHKEQIITWTLMCTIAFSFVAYIYLVNRTVLNVVARKEMESTLATLGSHVSELEFDYIGLKNAVTMQYAADKGFVKADENKNVYFAIRDTNHSLSLNVQQ